MSDSTLKAENPQESLQVQLLESEMSGLKNALREKELEIKSFEVQICSLEKVLKEKSNEILNISNVISSNMSLDAELSASKHEVAKLVKILEEKTKEGRVMDELETEIKSLKDMDQNYIKRIKDLENKIEAMQQDSEVYAMKINSLEERNSESEEKIELNNVANAQLNDKLKDAQVSVQLKDEELQKLSQVVAANAALEDDLKVSRGEIERLVKSLEEKKVDGTTVEKLLCEINSMKETEIENSRIIMNFEEQVKKLFNDSELQTKTIALLKSEHAEAEMQLKLKLLENEQLKAKFTDSQQATTDDLENQRKLMDSRTKELNEKIVSLHQELSDAKEIELKAAELEKEVERLKFDLQESERVCEIVDTECNRLESELEETKVKLTEKLATSLQSTMIAGQHTVMDDISMDCTLIPSVYEKYRKLEEYKSELEIEVNQLRQRIDGMASKEAEHNLKTQLVKEKEHATRISEENCSLKENIKSLEKKAADKMYVLEQQLARVKEEVGIKNIEFASLKVDVEKGELEFKKKSEILQVCYNAFFYILSD